LDKKASKIVSSNVVSCVDKNKTSKIAHGVQEICFATIVGNFAGSPKIDMQDIERAAKGPRKDEFTVAGDGAVGSDAVWTLKNPIGNVFTIEGPEEPESDAMQSLVDTHVPGGRRGMVSRENITTKR
jgi:hypothetical protein